MHGLSRAVLLGPLLTCAISQATTLVENKTLAFPPYPDFALQKHEEGTVVLLVKFNQQGAVEKCKISNTSAPPDLAEYVRSYGEKNWHDPKLAGQLGQIPVAFHLVKSESTLSPPPYPDVALGYRLHGDILLSVTFDAEGRVDKCVIKSASTPQLLQNYTRRRVDDDWRSRDFAGKTISATVTYRMDGSIGWSSVHNIRTTTP